MRIISFIEDQEIIQAIWSIFLKSACTMITFIVTPTIPGMLAFSRKDQEYGEEESVCADEPQKRLTGAAKSLQTAPPHLHP
jgi:hypothetical protein